MANTFVMGDIHGACRALLQCLERSSFDFSEDDLICLGDVCDGWPETRQCVELLAGIPNLEYVLGNHDTWFLDWMETGYVEEIWYKQGGKATIASYQGTAVPRSHRAFLESAKPYLLSKNRLFVHAGIDPVTALENQSKETFLWDRVLARKALANFQAGRNEKLTSYAEVYLGHTPVPYTFPVNSGEVWLMDTGAGWEGQLTMMNVETKEIFQSDPVPSLYPGVPGRSGGN